MKNYYQDKWETLEKEANKKGGNGKEIVAALKDFYSIYDDAAVVWLAKLYDPKVGGFYYSNSGRDNDIYPVEGMRYPFGPDIESTNQATNFLKGQYVIKSARDLPEKMQEQMFNFYSSCLDPETGFFYHPQWPKELVDSKPSRRGRDLMWAEDMANKFGWKYPYPTANERLAGALKGDDESAKSIPEYLRSEEKLTEYLDSFDWVNRPYPSGNTIAAQVYPIKAAGLSHVVVEYLDKIQNKETGLWGNVSGYEAVNGHMKITCFYRVSELPIPNADKAVASIVDTMVGDTMPHTVCYQYNCWYSLRNILESLRSFGGEEGNKKADEIVKYLLSRAPEAIRVSKEKVLTFRKDDYSFSYFTNKTSDQSQGMPVAVPHTNEGDINASGICSGGIMGNLFGALELRDFFIPIYSPNAYNKFLENLKLD